MMKRGTLLAVAVAVAISVAGYLAWKRGTPYQGRYWSPNHSYYVQKYQTAGLGLPGHGSDAISGYVRLYNKDGVLIYERYLSFIRDVDPVWAEDKVYLRGVAEMDRNPWIMPTPASRR